MRIDNHDIQRRNHPAPAVCHGYTQAARLEPMECNREGRASARHELRPHARLPFLACRWPRSIPACSADAILTPPLATYTRARAGRRACPRSPGSSAPRPRHRPRYGEEPGSEGGGEKFGGPPRKPRAIFDKAAAPCPTPISPEAFRDPLARRSDQSEKAASIRTARPGNIFPLAGSTSRGKRFTGNRHGSPHMRCKR
jgi:hypothetical protein